MLHGKFEKNWCLIPFIQPGRFRNLVGGLMSPPYEGVRERYRAYNGVANTAQVRASLSAGIARQIPIFRLAELNR